MRPSARPVTEVCNIESSSYLDHDSLTASGPPFTGLHSTVPDVSTKCSRKTGCKCSCKCVKGGRGCGASCSCQACDSNGKKCRCHNRLGEIEQALGIHGKAVTQYFATYADKATPMPSSTTLILKDWKEKKEGLKEEETTKHYHDLLRYGLYHC